MVNVSELGQTFNAGECKSPLGGDFIWILDIRPQSFRVLGNCSCIALLPSVHGHMLTPLTYIPVGERALTGMVYYAGSLTST